MMTLDVPISTGDLDALSGRLRVLEASSPEACELATQTLDLARQAGHTLVVAASLYVLGQHHVAHKNFTVARPCFEEALALNALSDQDALDCLAALMNCMFTLGLYDLTLPLAQQLVVQSQKLNHQALEAEAYLRIGSSYFHLGMLQESLAACLLRLELLGQQDGPALNGVACVHWKLGDIDKALHYYQLALSIARQEEKRVDEGIALCNIANCYGDLGKREEALHYTLEAHRVFKACASYRHMALNLGNLGNFYVEEADYDKALESFTEALELQKSSPERGIEGWLEMRLAHCYMQQQQYGEALLHLHKALVMMEEAKALEDLYEVHRFLSESYEHTGDFPKALEHYKAFHHYKEQVFNETMSKQTKLLMTQFEVERIKQDQEMERLKNVELAGAIKQLEELSSRDGLTGLYNRRYLDEQLGHLLEQAKLFNQPLSVLISDIDNFKQINDRFSHALGDEVLKKVAAIFTENVWGKDIVARYGGEEFVAVFSDTSLDNAWHIAEKIRLSVAAYPWHELQQGLRVTVSMGLANDVTSSLEGLMSLADAKLYEAKRNGKNQVRG